MLSILQAELKTKKIQRQALFFFIFFMFVYTLVDSFNMSYGAMANQYSKTLVIVNVLLNIIMSVATAFLMSLSAVMIKIKAIEPKGTNMGVLSVFFAILTYGCTPCVIALFANFGITFSVIVLPLAGLPYKIMTLFLIALGIIWSLYDINRGACKVKIN